MPIDVRRLSAVRSVASRCEVSTMYRDPFRVARGAKGSVNVHWCIVEPDTMIDVLLAMYPTSETRMGLERIEANGVMRERRGHH